MTGRRLYDLWCDALARESDWSKGDGGFQLPAGPTKAWPFLTLAERRVWNEAARRATPRRKRT